MKYHINNPRSIVSLFLKCVYAAMIKDLREVSYRITIKLYIYREIRSIMLFTFPDIIQKAILIISLSDGMCANPIDSSGPDRLFDHISDERTVITADFEEDNVHFMVNNSLCVDYSLEPRSGIGCRESIIPPHETTDSIIDLINTGTVLSARMRSRSPYGPRCFFWSDEDKTRSSIFYHGHPLQDHHNRCSRMHCYVLDSPTEQIVVLISFSDGNVSLMKPVLENGISTTDLVELYHGGISREHIPDVSIVDILETPARDTVCIVRRINMPLNEDSQLYSAQLDQPLKPEESISLANSIYCKSDFMQQQQQPRR